MDNGTTMNNIPAEELDMARAWIERTYPPFKGAEGIVRLLATEYHRHRRGSSRSGCNRAVQAIENSLEGIQHSIYCYEHKTEYPIVSPNARERMLRGLREVEAEMVAAIEVLRTTPSEAPREE